jgi:hypothetical protein
VRLGGRGTDRAFRASTSTRIMPNRRPRVREQSSLRRAGDGGTESVGQLHDPQPKSHRGGVHAKTSGESRSQTCRRRQAGSGEEAEYLWDENLSHQKYIIPHQEMAKQTGTVSPKLCMNQEFSQTTRAQEDARSAMEQCLVLGSTELVQEGRQTSAEVGIPSLQLPDQTPGHCGEGPTQL